MFQEHRKHIEQSVSPGHPDVKNRDYVRKEQTGEPTTNPKHFGTVAKSAGRSVDGLNQDIGNQVQETHMPGLIKLTVPTNRVLDAIADAGGHPYLVGGCVRDALIEPGRIPKDVDIEVFGLDIDALSIALKSVGNVDEVGVDFSVLKMCVDGEDFDISLPRKDVKTAEGHRGFSVEADPNSSLPDATARRDFTINALMYDPATGNVIDCWGGLNDLMVGILRHTTDAFAEDPLRVLRGVQFAARFGYTMHPDTIALARELADDYDHLPTERVWEEWHKIASKGRHIGSALETLRQTGWEKHYPQISVLHDVEQDPTWHPEGNVHVHSGMAADKAAELADIAGLDPEDRTVIVLAAMVHDFGKATHTQHAVDKLGNPKITSHGHDHAGVEPADEFLISIGASKVIRDRVKPLVREHMCSSTVKTVTRPAVRRLARRLSPATLNEWAMVTAADKGGRGSGSVDAKTDQWLEMYEEESTRMSPLLTGQHLIDSGMTPGPAFKPVLAAALEAQDEGVFDDETGALAWFTSHSAL